MRAVKPRAESIEELRKICQSGKTVSFNDKVERKISIYFTRLLLHTGITANQVTFLDILIGIIACAFLVVGHPWYTFIGAMLLQLWIVFDYVDGEIARYRKSCAISGIYLDKLNHLIVEPLIFVCISSGLFRIFFDVGIFALGFSAAMSKLMMHLARDGVEVSVVEFLLNSKLSSIRRDRLGSQIAEQTDYLQSVVPISHSSIPLKAISFMFFWGKVWMLLIAAIIDILVPTMRIGEFAFNSIYIFLLIYGIFSHSVWIGTVFLILKNRSCEKLYFLIVERACYGHQLDEHP